MEDSEHEPEALGLAEAVGMRTVEAVVAVDAAAAAATAAAALTVVIERERKEKAGIGGGGGNGSKSQSGSKLRQHAWYTGYWGGGFAWAHPLLTRTLHGAVWNGFSQLKILRLRRVSRFSRSLD